MLIITCTHDPVIPDNSEQGSNAPDTTGNGDSTNNNPEIITCDPDTVYFENDILPIFISNCAFAPCHDAGTMQSNLDLSNYSGVMTEVTPFSLAESDIYDRITDPDPDKLMPRIVGQETGQSLQSNQINLIQTWINQGAKNNKCEECDTVNVTFSNDIQEIFQRNCNTTSSCHGANSSLPSWDNYQIIKNNIPQFQVRVIDRSHQSPMPPSGSIPDCDLNKLKIWINDGATDN